MHYPYEKHAIPKVRVLCYNTHNKKKSEDGSCSFNQPDSFKEEFILWHVLRYRVIFITEKELLKHSNLLKASAQ